MTQTRCPEHYRFGSLQAKDIIEQVISPIRDAVRAYHTATALKYLLRHTRKAGVGDLLKCRDHLDWAIARAQGAPSEVAADSTTWRHGDIDKVCGDSRTGVSFSVKPEMGRNLPIQGIRDAVEFTQPPNCSPGVSEPTPPMHAVALEMAEAATCRKRHQPALDMDVNETVFQLPDNSAYELRPISTCDVGGGLGPGLGPSARPSDPLNFDAPEYQTLVGN